ncbi:MAG: ATP-binding protein [Elusimicrobia bacterium RIFCSPLOWO2_01_FULL_59_12]|nr:MAG: ATP-binding protein [Elusimicrobia bacterium RIFCSPLOWO2_01_FULL_59_12]
MGIVAQHVGKVIGAPPTRILSDITLDIREGEFVSLTGRSGAGKSTLLYLLSSLDKASEGTIEIEGQDVGRMSGEALSRFRNEKMGFVFQFHYLIAELNALENTLLPARKFKQQERRKAHAEKLLERFGLGDKLNRLPRQLSGGEMQRVAIARALVMEPRYVFADEPTGSLDTANGERVINILREANETSGTTVVLVTHEPEFANLAKRQIHLRDGRVV